MLLRLWMKFISFSAIFKKTIGPGPTHAIDPTITNKGKDGTPHYSLSSRHKELVPFNTPRPGTYGVEKKPTCFQGEKQSPAYSIGGRSKYRRRKCTIYVKLYYVSSYTFLWAHPPSTYSFLCCMLHCKARNGIIILILC